MALNVKKGIDLQNRLWDRSFALRFKQAFYWWRGGTFNRFTLGFVAIVFIINLFIVFPLFSRNVSASFNSSALLTVAQLFEKLGFFHASTFFSFLTITSLAFSPISFYLFVRKMAMRHELTAFLATLLYVLPNPFLGSGSSLAGAILSGDGAHAFVFAFIPLFLLYVQAFIATGMPFWGAMAAIGTALVAIISPFAFFNIIVIFIILTIAEGFLGALRIKFARLGVLLLASVSLSLFWYYPNVLTRIMVLSHVKFAAEKFWAVFPLLIPAIPVIGFLSFLIFDRRERLKPVFIGLSLFLIYLFLYMASKSINTTGIFTADRYLIEFSFAIAFAFALLFVALPELLVRNYLLRIEHPVLFFGAIAFISAIVSFMTMATIKKVQAVQEYIASAPIIDPYHEGIGSIKRAFSATDVGSIIASLISLSTFLFIIVILRRFTKVDREVEVV